MSKEIPVQQTLWRVWIPEGFYYLGHSRLFSQISINNSQNLLYSLLREQYGDRIPPQTGFKLVGQGQVQDFIAQGRPESLFVLAMSKELFSIVVWAVIIIAGIVMLKVKGNNRVMIILAVILAAGVVYLFHPVLVLRIFKTGWFAIALVLLLWLAQWGFTKMPELRKKAAARREQIALGKKQQNEIKQQTNAKSSQKPEDKK